MKKASEEREEEKIFNLYMNITPLHNNKTFYWQKNKRLPTIVLYELVDRSPHTPKRRFTLDCIEIQID